MGKILKGTPGDVEVTGEIKKALSEDQIKSFVAMPDLTSWLALLW